ncbi:hypothetical protein M0805_006262 [Coniferiporia weirii]|nr:hypothetical protein M0805_006262 [Coniferiporia weirii]
MSLKLLTKSLSEYVERASRKQIHRHHRRKHNFYVTAVIALIVAAFILLLLVALSLPIIKPVYLLSVVSTATETVPTSIATELRFGVWGYCATGVLDAPTLFTNDGECSKPRLGYDVEPSILALTGQEQLLEIVLKGLIVVLVLHPACAGLALLTLIPTLFSYVHAAAIIALVFTIVTALLTSLSAAIDIAVVAVAMSKVGEVTTFQFAVQWGNAPWMCLAAAVLLWIVVVLQSVAVCGCCGVSRNLWTHYDKASEIKEKRIEESER